LKIRKIEEEKEKVSRKQSGWKREREGDRETDENDKDKKIDKKMKPDSFGT
jgi:hypothetical protein